ncbi:hypothetical protein [Chitinophaga sp.]|nr:hypothetical protein [Chitinophaga sp.]
MKKKIGKKMTLGSVKVARLTAINDAGKKGHTIFTTTTHRTFDC